MSKKTKKPAVITTQIREKGRNIFQPNLINWSYLYLGVEALTHKKINKIKIIFILFIFLWVRATTPRYRYDQLMRLGWKIFLPFSLIWVVLTAGFLVFFDLVPKSI